MKYISIDIETTGLSEVDQILEIGAIIEDTNNQLSFDEIPKFECILNYDRISGSPFALNLNSRILEILSKIPTEESQKRLNYLKKYKIINPEDLGLSFYTFLTSNGYTENKNRKIKIITAGKNFSSFDKKYLEKNESFYNYINLGHKSLDPVSLYVDYNRDDELPSLIECKKRAGLNDIVTHKAIEDAWDVVELLRKKY